MKFDGATARQWRKDAGFSIEEACVAARLSYPYLSALERGRFANPSISVVTRIAALYGRDPTELLVADSQPVSTR